MWIESISKEGEVSISALLSSLESTSEAQRLLDDQLIPLVKALTLEVSGA